MRHDALLRAWLPPLALLALLVGLMLFLAGTFREKVAAGALPPDAAQAVARRAAVRALTLPDALEQIGTLRSRHRAEVASKVLAEVLELKVEPGAEVVAAGPGREATLIAVLDARDLKAKLASAQAQVSVTDRMIRVQTAEGDAARAAVAAVQARLDRAEADFRRYAPLVAAGTVTSERLDQVRADRDVARADLSAAQSRVTAALEQLARAEAERVLAQRLVEEATVLLGYTQVRAPLRGVVVEKLVEAGDTVRPGQGLVRVEDPSRLELHAAVAESLAARLALGKELEVRVDALALTLRGTVREIAPAADPASRTLSVKVALPAAPGLVSGLSGRLRVPLPGREALVVPAAALRRVGQLDLVDVVVEGRRRRRFVTLGVALERAGEALVEVRSGLAAGEEVALP